MKKFLLFLFILVLGAVAASLWLIPSKVDIAASVKLNAPLDRAAVFMSKQEKWKKWWPGDTESNRFVLNNKQYVVVGNEAYTTQIEINAGDSTVLTSKVVAASEGLDASNFEWTLSKPLSSNPFVKLKQYFTERTMLQSDINSLFQSFKAFTEKQENLYGMKIEKTRVVDTVLVATRSTLDHYPTTEEIYSLVGKLRAYIKAENATETNFPMLNVSTTDNKAFNVMVGIPTSRLLQGKGDIELKRMVLGNILYGEVKGNSAIVQEAFENMENYKYDYKLTSPAIPFALLVTDRSKEPDSNKWVTRIYSPIF